LTINIPINEILIININIFRSFSLFQLPYFAILPGGAKAVAHTLTPVTIRMLQDGA
jgi:hypothetical protein